LKELFRPANVYLVNRSSKVIFDVTTAFLDPENVDFDILYAILLTFWSNFNMRYCVGGGHLGFSGCRNFCRKLAEFGDSKQQSTYKKPSYDAKISLYQIGSGFTNCVPDYLAIII